MKSWEDLNATAEQMANYGQSEVAMRKNIVIFVLATLVIWLTVIVVNLENFHYATTVGMCSEFKADDPYHLVKRHNCLHSTETRTSQLWHLFYALAGEQ